MNDLWEDDYIADMCGGVCEEERTAPTLPWGEGWYAEPVRRGPLDKLDGMLLWAYEKQQGDMERNAAAFSRWIRKMKNERARRWNLT